MATVVFNDMDELFKMLGENRAAADSRIEPWQRIEPGTFFVSANPEVEILIFGEVLDPVAELIRGAEDPDCPEIRMEAADIKRTYADPDMAGYRFTRCFSVACPTGEMGDTHLSTISAVISKEVFEAAVRTIQQRAP